MMNPVAKLMLDILNIYSFVIFISIALNLLVHFNIVNQRQALIRMIDHGLGAITEPIFRPLRKLQRKIFPNLQMLDLSPLFTLLILNFIGYVIVYFTVSGVY